jgi:hypothetical protein
MSTRPVLPVSSPTLFGAEGELVRLHISVEPKLLEELLDSLAGLDFPVNPELIHKANSVIVEFPAYSGRIPEVHRVLSNGGFDPACLGVEHALLAHA